MEYDITAILSDIGIDYKLEGFFNKINGFSSIEQATEHDLSFCSSKGTEAISSISKSAAGLILCNSSMQGAIHPKPGKGLIFVDDARIAFIKIVNHIQKEEKVSAISEYAAISKSAKIGSNCQIGAFTFIGDNCVIEDNTIIYDRVSLIRNCKIGQNCIIWSGVTIGAEGFGFERLSSGQLERFPHLKGVIIGNNVEICPNSAIARGSLSDTKIGDETKIDALVSIAHNVQIGRSCLLTEGAIVGGSVKIGDECWLGLNSTIKQKVKIGNNVLVAAGACVLHDVPDQDVVAGIPAKSIKEKVSSDRVFMMAGQKK
ncbi:MAG TPA: UDP-3-O-(3-hydroxymyristoyl)glucosamine N-acyltransferase [Nitrososphaera sp.]